MKIIFFVLVVAMIFSFTRCVLFTLYRAPFECLKDMFDYIIHRKWKEFHGYGLDIYIGYFGQGKTLSAVNYVVDMYYRYGVTVYSNIKLSIPYIPLENFQQIVDAEHEKGTLVLIDEISTVFSHRAWKDFPIGLLWKVLQCRKRKVKLVATAQRFHMVDALLRGITDHVIKCEKWWRYVNNKFYDAWELENSINPSMIKNIGNYWWFCTNKDYNNYDTSEVVNNTEQFKAGNYVTNKEMLDALGDINKDSRTSNLSRKGKKKFG
jgi:hypothetical protein